MASKDEPFDPYEIGARNSDPELGALQPLPPAPRRTPPLTLLAYFGVAVVVVAILRGAASGGPAVEGSCDAPAFALDTEEVAQFGVVRWSANGPADAAIVIGVDTTTVPTGIDDGKLSGPTALPGCAASGQFGMRADEGEHTVTAFLVAADGSSRVLQTTKVLVTAP